MGKKKNRRSGQSSAPKNNNSNDDSINHRDSSTKPMDSKETTTTTTGEEMEVEKCEKAPIEHRRSSSTQKTVLRCSQCSFTCFTPSGLYDHTNSHTGTRPYECRHCAKSFTHRSALWNHQRLHFDERPFQCRYCAANFKWKNSLQAHLLVHARDRQKLDADDDDVGEAKSFSYAGALRGASKHPVFYFDDRKSSNNVDNESRVANKNPSSSSSIGDSIGEKKKSTSKKKKKSASILHQRNEEQTPPLSQQQQQTESDPGVLLMEDEFMLALDIMLDSMMPDQEHEEARAIGAVVHEEQQQQELFWILDQHQQQFDSIDSAYQYITMDSGGNHIDQTYANTPPSSGMGILEQALFESGINNNIIGDEQQQCESQSPVFLIDSNDIPYGANEMIGFDGEQSLAPVANDSIVPQQQGVENEANRDMVIDGQNRHESSSMFVDQSNIESREMPMTLW